MNRHRISVKRSNSTFSSAIIVLLFHFISFCLALPHDSTERNKARFDLLTWSTLRVDKDGYKQVKKLVHIVEVKKSDIVIHLKVNVNAEDQRSN